MKWEKIKDRAVSIIHEWRGTTGHGPGKELAMAAVMECSRHGKDWQATFEEMLTECIRIVDAWDVRMAAKLRDIFPDAFPRQLQKCPLAAKMEDTPDADWIVYNLQTTNTEG